MGWNKDLDERIALVKKYGVKKASEMLGISYGSLRTFLWKNNMGVRDTMFEERKALIEEYGIKKACEILNVSTKSMYVYMWNRGISIKELTLDKVFNDWFKDKGFTKDDWKIMRVAFEAGVEYQKRKNVSRKTREQDWK